MAVTIGNMEAFDESVELWTTYIERFEHFVEANSIDAEKKSTCDTQRDQMENIWITPKSDDAGQAEREEL